MARTSLLPSQVATGTAGLALTTVNGDNVNGMNFPSRSARILIVQNPTAGAISVTIRDAATTETGAPPDRVVVVPAAIAGQAGMRIFGPIGQQFTQSDGTVWVDFSATGTNVSLVDVSG